MAVTAMTTGVASGAGTAVVDEVRELVRGRLEGSDEGRGALRRLDAEPRPEGAADDVRARLTALLEEDPELARRLQAALEPDVPPPPAAPPTVHQQITIGGSANHSTIVIGPVELPRTRGVLIALTGIGVVLAVLLVLGFRTVLQSLTDDDGGGPQGSDGKRVTALKNASDVNAILPDSGTLPGGWVITDPPDVKKGAIDDDCGSSCTGVLFSGTVRHEMEPSDGAYFAVETYDTAEHAAARFKAAREDQNRNTGAYEPMSIEPVGDESMAYRKKIVNASEAEAGARVGTVVTWVVHRAGSSSLDPGDLNVLTRMLAERAQQAQNGEKPFARAEF
ncbi:hypothetical protein GCM10010245_55860 [Streptomyces spectabilis]|nr:hypothetical protein CP982_37630 [Streptomyces spectabilis]GGV34793.1 hypothetical protein GCM10010245_55860 [Streptomyces spectabilis]